MQDSRTTELNSVDPAQVPLGPSQSMGAGAAPSRREHLLAIWGNCVLPGTYRPALQNRYGQLVAVKPESCARSGSGEVAPGSTAFMYGTPVLMPSLAGHQTGADLARTIGSSPSIAHFAAIVDTETGLVFATDHLGSIPIYITEGVAGTHLFDVARAAGVSSIDEVAVSEFLQHGYITSPFTIFDGIKRLEPGSVFSLIGDRTICTTYWQPEEDLQAQISDVAVEAFGIMDRNLEAVARAYPEVALLYSGGEDSRVLARLLRKKIEPSDRLTATTFLDHRNREYRLAGAAAKIIGVRQRVRWRKADLYADAATRFADDLSGVFDAQHFHAWNLLQEGDADIFVDGWTSDTFMKGLYLPKARRRIWRVPYGLHRPVPLNGLQPPAGELGEEILCRRLKKLSLLKAFRQSDPEVYVNMWPISDHPDYGFFASNQAQRPTATPFMYGNFLDVITRLPEATKATNQLFWMTFGRNLGVAGFVPRSGGEIPRFPPVVQPPFIALTRLSLAADARVRNTLGLPPKAQGPWLDGQAMKASAFDAVAGYDPQCLRIALQLRHDSWPKSAADLSGPEALRVLQIAQLLREGILSP